MLGLCRNFQVPDVAHALQPPAPLSMHTFCDEPYKKAYTERDGSTLFGEQHSDFVRRQVVQRILF
jgi:hypothetical protein